MRMRHHQNKKWLNICCMYIEKHCIYITNFWNRMAEFSHNTLCKLLAALPNGQIIT